MLMKAGWLALLFLLWGTPIKINEGDPDLNVNVGSDLDSEHSSVAIMPELTIPKGDSIESWEIVVQDEKGRPMKTYKGNGKPKVVKFDGKGDDGKEVNSVSTYGIHATYKTKNGTVIEKESSLNTGVLVRKEGTDLKIKVPPVEFDPNAATFDTLTEEQVDSNERILTLVSAALKKYQDYKVIVEGHANNVSGAPEEEEELGSLSEARADKIKEMLITKGVNADALSAVGRGGTKPIGTGDEAWRNRRVEFILRK